MTRGQKRNLGPNGDTHRDTKRQTRNSTYLNRQRWLACKQRKKSVARICLCYPWLAWPSSAFFLNVAAVLPSNNHPHSCILETLVLYGNALRFPKFTNTAVLFFLLRLLRRSCKRYSFNFAQMATANVALEFANALCCDKFVFSRSHLTLARMDGRTNERILCCCIIIISFTSTWTTIRASIHPSIHPLTFLKSSVASKSEASSSRMETI